MDMPLRFDFPPVMAETRLWKLRKGQRATIRGFDDELPAGYRTRLTEMGFHPGETVTCLLRPAFGSPRVYRVSNTVYSLDEDIAGRIRMALHD